MSFHSVCGCLSVKLTFTMDFAFLKPYFHGLTTRMGAPFWLGSTSPYQPNVSRHSGFIASSIRSPSEYGQSYPPALSGMSLLLSSERNCTNLALGSGSAQE